MADGRVASVFWADKRLAGLSSDARLLLLGLWSVADSEGMVGDWSADRFKAMFFSADSRVSAKGLRGLMDSLVQRRVVFVFNVPGYSSGHGGYVVGLERVPGVEVREWSLDTPVPGVGDFVTARMFLRRDGGICRGCREAVGENDFVLRSSDEKAVYPSCLSVLHPDCLDAASVAGRHFAWFKDGVRVGFDEPRFAVRFSEGSAGADESDEGGPDSESPIEPPIESPVESPVEVADGDASDASRWAVVGFGEPDDPEDGVKVSKAAAKRAEEEAKIADFLKNKAADSDADSSLFGVDPSMVDRSVAKEEIRKAEKEAVRAEYGEQQRALIARTLARYKQATGKDWIQRREVLAGIFLHALKTLSVDEIERGIDLVVDAEVPFTGGVLFAAAKGRAPKMAKRAAQEDFVKERVKGSRESSTYYDDAF